jgi:hypothetical protein
MASGLPSLRIDWIACRDTHLMKRLVACREHIALEVLPSARAYLARARDSVTHNRAVVAAAVTRHPRLDRVLPAAGASPPTPQPPGPTTGSPSYPKAKNAPSTAPGLSASAGKPGEKSWLGLLQQGGPTRHTRAEHPTPRTLPQRLPVAIRQLMPLPVRTYGRKSVQAKGCS